MLSVSFQGARKLRRVLKSKSHRYSLNDAQRLLNEAEQYAADHQLSETIIMVIHGDNNRSAFVDQLEFGKHLSYINSLIAVVQHTLSSELFTDYPITEKEAFMARLSQQLQSENKNQLVSHTVSVEQESIQNEIEPETPVSEPIQSDGYSTQKQDIEDDEGVMATTEPDSKKAPVFVASEQHHSESQRLTHGQGRQPSPSASQKWFMVLGVLFVFCVLFAVGHRVLSSVNQPATYSELISKKEYLAAAKTYPKKRADIENKLASVGSEKILRQFVTAYPSNEGKFDLAFKRAKYAQVVDLSTKAEMTTLRKTMLAIAYVKTNQIDQAAVLNADLNSSKLTLAITLGYVHAARFDEATALNKTLNNKSLEKVIDTGRIYQQAIEKYQRDANDKKNSAAERKSAAANVQAFTHQLQTLGE